MDLYKSTNDGVQWSKPINLGAAINTQKNEVFPFYKNDKLYYSSDGFPGYGGLDIFVASYVGGWQSPKNLRSPINSSRDDFSIYFISDSTGYYASNRIGGKGEDDIYSFYLKPNYTEVEITGIFEYEGLAMQNSKVSLVDGNDSIIAVNYTDSAGRFKFQKLAYSEDYYFKVETEDSELIDGGRIFLTNSEGDKIKLIERLKDGKFKFEALPSDEMELDLLAEEDTKALDNFQFSGKVFNKLPGDYGREVMVYLVDEEGTIIDSVLSDVLGNFNFSKLEMDNNKQYFVLLEE